jgi:poly-gamma-glutamate capsule biosynthesis protein CapA/YwtB (metallophosphatase superfamily)
VLLAPLRPLLADADIILLNIEGAIGEGAASSKCRAGSRNCYAFRQPTVTAIALRGLNDTAEVIGNIANNHAMDAGRLGFEATHQHLRRAGVHVTGADSMATTIVTSEGDTVAFLGFSTAQAGPDPRDLAAVRRHVVRAAAEHSRVVVTMHMGAEGVGAQRTPSESEEYLGEDRGNSVAFAHAAVDAGASAVIGHGPHVMRAAEWYGGALVLYSLGNLLTYGPFSLAEPLNRGGIACVTLGAEGDVEAAVLRSTYQQPPGILQRDPTGRAAWLVDSLSQLDFPLSAARLHSEAVIRR